ncbi:hypothetical protein CAL18_15730 [Bordetella genomosp. 7]|uniref:hypothetical protein n=1 Tax=Bordetella genomosp. 7 TaxID=1416805 RepID=UPI000B9E326C|nr:hypothetical protein [Bordetella genomosp. 7]OZI17565.1 hypothetical protein CAL18_15730 [Bordetella genomosp. 7]
MSTVSNDPKLDLGESPLAFMFEQLVTHIRRQDDTPPRNAEPGEKAPAFEEYDQIMDPNSTANDTVVYRGRDGKQVIVLRSTNPALYEQVVADYHTMKALKEAGDGAVRVKEDAEPPAIAEIEQVDTSRAGQGVIVYTLDGKQHVVARSTNPEAFAAAEQAGKVYEGHRIATDNEKWPPVLGTTVEAPGEAAPGVIRYEHDGNKVAVSQETNPKLYEYLEDLHELGGDEAAMEAIEESAGKDGKIADANTPQPGFDEVKSVEQVADGVLKVELEDGGTLTVSKTLNPTLFEGLTQTKDVKDAIKESEDAGYEVAKDDLKIENVARTGPPDELAPGTVRIEIKDGDKVKKYIVVEALTPELYQQASGLAVEHRTDELDDLRGEYDLPKLDELDVASMETTEKDKDGKTLNVGELTWKTLVEQWKSDIDSGKIGKDDDRFKLYMALRLQAAGQNGLDMTSLDIGVGLDLQKVTAEDIKPIIDGGNIEAYIEKMFGTEAVQKDFAEHQKRAIESVADKDALKRIEDRAFSEDYVRYIADLKEQRKDAMAQADIVRTYQSLAAIDQAKADEFLQSIQFHSTLVDIDKLVGDPTLVSEENQALATQDATKLFLTALKKLGVDLPRRTVESIDKFVNEFLKDKQKASDFNKALQELGDKWNTNGYITQKDIDDLLKNGKYKALDELSDGSMRATLAEMNKMGMLGSMGGLISLASGIYQAVGKGGTLADTPEERLAIAKDLVGFFGAFQHFTTLGANIRDMLVAGSDKGKAPEGTPKAPTLVEVLALDKSFPEIFGKGKPAGPRTIGTHPSEVPETFARIIDEAPEADKDRLRETLNLSEDEYKKIEKGITDGYQKNSGIKGATPGTRAVSSVLKVINIGADTFSGVADMVIGALKLQKANGDPVAKAEGAITIAAGGFTTLGGISSGATSAGLTAARAFTAPLFWVGAALSVVTIFFSIYYDEKNRKAMNANKEDLNQLFTWADGEGLLSENGLKKYEFLESYIYNYGQRDAPEDQSIFSYREDEVNYYLEEGFLVDESDHHDYDGDGANLDTQME